MRIGATLDSLLAAGLVVRASGAAQVQAAGAPEKIVPFGFAAIDTALPGGGLARAALHELVGDSAARALAAIIAGRAGGPVFWIQLERDAQEDGRLYPYGLAALGLDPDRVFAVTAASAQDALWAMEESLRAGCAGAVIGDGLAPDLTASRRLLLAAESGSGPALVLRPAQSTVGAADSEAARGKNSSAAVTTWHVASAASADDVGPGAPRWELTLVRCRGGRVPLHWQVEWSGTQLVEPTKPRRLAPRIAESTRRARLMHKPISCPVSFDASQTSRRVRARAQ
jgi:protein ImuA